MKQPLRLSSTSEMPMQASKWLKVQLLVDNEEMTHLVQSLPPFFIYQTSLVTNVGEEEVAHSKFLTVYRDYVEDLKSGKVPDDPLYRQLFSTVFTVCSDSLYLVPFDSGRQLVRIFSPVVQLQAHHMDFFPLDKKFRSMSFGTQAISWGIQFSYPQLYQNPHSLEPEKVGANFPNTALFHALQQWVRNHTIPTPFHIGELQVNSPMRLGKNCLSWVNNHPQLKEKAIVVG